MIERERGYILLKKLEIPFSDYVLISKKRRPRYYIKDHCRVPIRYQTEQFGWNSKDQLVDLVTKVPIVANFKSVGKPRYKKVSGQDIYNGNVSRQSRASLVKGLHQMLATYIREIEPLHSIDNYPLGLHLSFHVYDEGKNNLDNDNRWIWNKVVQDTLVEQKVIPDDNPYIIWENLSRTILISKEKEPKLTIEIYGYA